MSRAIIDDAGPVRVGIAALLASQFCTSAAAMAQVTIVGKVVYDITHSELDLGLLGLAEFAPALVLMLLVGAVADRFDRRRVVALAALGCAAIALVLGWYVGGHPRSSGPIFALVLGYGVCVAFANPAARSLPADTVMAERLPSLVARNSAAWQAALIVGPVLGALLYPVDPRVPFVAVAGLDLAAIALVLLVRVRERLPFERPEEGELHAALEGLRFVRRLPVLLGAISLDLFAVLFGGAVTLLPAIAKDRLGVGVVGLGWLRAAGGMGAGAVTLALAARPIAKRVGLTLLSAVAVFGVFTVLLGVTRDFTVAFIAMLVLSGADAVSVFIRATLVPLVTPDDKRGRVLAVENVFIGASNELGGFESGVAGQLLGTSASVVLGGVATLVVAVAWCGLFPQLRRVDRFPDPSDDDKQPDRGHTGHPSDTDGTATDGPFAAPPQAG